MYTVKSSTEFIADVKALDEKLKNIRLSAIEINREDKSVHYSFICDVAVSEDLQRLILKEAEKITSCSEKYITPQKNIQNK